MKLNKQNNFSSFWLGDSLENKSLIENDVDTKPGVDHIKLAGYQRAISNFVNILIIFGMAWFISTSAYNKMR